MAQSSQDDVASSSRTYADSESLFVQGAQPGEGYEDLEISELLELSKQKDQDSNKDAEATEPEKALALQAPSLSELSQQQQIDTYRFFKKHPITLSTLLPYQKRIVVEMLKQDGLVLIARGLGLIKIASNLIHALDVAGSGLNDLDISKPKDSRAKPPQSLVIVLGARETELESIREELRELAVIDGMTTIYPDEESDDEDESEPLNGIKRQRGITVMNTETATTAEKREKLYAKGGIFVVTSRIFVVDLLAHTIDPTKITGVVIMHAEKVEVNSIESFILRLIRQKNKVAFIKALSEEPESFGGFAPLATMMKTLRVSKVFLWPRFHVNVIDSLSLRHLMYLSTRTGQWKRPQTVDITSVVEIEVALSESMRNIQTATMECIEFCVSEIKKRNPQIEVEFWNLDSAMSQNFDRIIKAQLNPIWHNISAKTKRIIQDLTILRQILANVCTYDCISFQKTLEPILESNRQRVVSMKYEESDWIQSNAADTLFTAAKERLFGPKLKAGEKRTHLIEELPKWDQLAKILAEISSEKTSGASHTESQGPILIMCKTRNTANQLSSYLRTMDEVESSGFKHFSGQRYLGRLLREYKEWRKGFKNVRVNFQQNKAELKAKEQAQKADQKNENRFGKPLNKRRRVRGGSSVAGNSDPHSKLPEGTKVYEITENDDNNDIAMLENMPIDIDLENEAQTDGVEIISVQDSVAPIIPNDLVLIHTYDKARDGDFLQELAPSYIIIYEPDPSFIRQVEVYRSSNPYRLVRVFFLYYGLSVEEQRYLAAVRKEKDTFTQLIREKAALPIKILNELDDEDPERAFRRIAASSGGANSRSRIAGGQIIRTGKEPPRIIVDHREFRSSLPGLIHAKFITLVPLMLTVGDFVLSPRICVERKSVTDLISSFKDGRLYTQCEAMFRYYEQPCLLIEFDESKSFSLEPFSEAPGYGGATSIAGTVTSTETAKLMQEKIQTKLVILLLHFPRLKIIWSSSPSQTAEIFYDLKLGDTEEPDVEACANFGLRDNLIAESDRLYNHAAIDFLKALPGVTASNYRTLVNEYRSLQKLASASADELGKFVGLENARKLVHFLEKNVRSA